jgi:hypothetical protein
MSGDALWNNIDQIMSLIRLYGGTVNPSCGLHAHFDMTNATTSERTMLLGWWTYFEPMFFSLVPGHRRNNAYTRKLGWRSQRQCVERYGALNTHAFREHRTFEVRLHHATLDADELRLWLHILLRFFDTFQGYSKLPNAMQEMSMRGLTAFFMSETKLDWRTRRKLVARCKQYGWAEEYKQPTPSALKAPTLHAEDSWRSTVTHTTEALNWSMHFRVSPTAVERSNT